MEFPSSVMIASLGDGTVRQSLVPKVLKSASGWRDEPPESMTEFGGSSVRWKVALCTSLSCDPSGRLPLGGIPR